VRSDGRWSVPSRRALTRRLVRDGQTVAATAAAALSRMDAYALSADGWTSSGNSSYLAIMAHAIDKDWNRRSIVLGMKQLTEKHTAGKLAETIRAHVYRHGNV